MLADELDEELRPGFDQFSELDELFVDPLREVGENAQAAAGLARDVVSGAAFKIPKATEDGFAPDDPIMAPANGVTFEQWVAVSADMIHDGATPDQADAYAGRHGVPAGAWPDGLGQWRRRQMGHPLMAEKYGRALERRRKELGSR